MAISHGVFAILVNPRDATLHHGFLDYNKVKLYSLDNTHQGQGYFNDGNSKYRVASDVTGLPRVHTPSGVREGGTGLGTVLYTALCTAAHLRFENVLGFEADVDGDGISSQEGTRSKSAEAWWENAKERYGLAHLVEGEVEEEFDRCFSRGIREWVEQALANSLEGAASVDVDHYELCAGGTANILAQADAYPWENATKRHLVVALYRGDESAEEPEATDPGAWELVSREALVSANLAEFAGSRDEGMRAVLGWLLAFGKAGGLSARELDLLRLRAAYGVDLDPSTWEGFGPEAYEALRENPARRVLGRGSVRRRNGRVVPVRYVATAPTVWQPRFLPPMVVTRHGRRMNPPEVPAELARALSDLHERRAALGWGVFAGEPEPRKNPRARTRRKARRPARRKP